MKAFDPKEYKREIIVFNLFKGRVMLVFPSGAKVKYPAHLLEGDYKDGRRITILKDMGDVKSKEKGVAKGDKRVAEFSGEMILNKKALHIMPGMDFFEKSMHLSKLAVVEK